MSSTLTIDAIEQLKPFLNSDGVLEIAVRKANKKFKTFQKIALSNAPQNESKELIQNAISAINKNHSESTNLIQNTINLMNKNNVFAEKSLEMLSNLSKMQQLTLILSGANLCATCVGFAIVYAKLDKMSGQINKLMSVVKQGNEVRADYEFKKVISEHSNMLDCRKTQKYYTEEQMRKLVDDEYNVLNLLLDVFMKDLATDQESLIFSMYSLSSMLAVSLRYFDELYYFNNKEAIGDGDVWHSSHDNWMSIFDKLASNEVLRKIQDHGIFDLNLSTTENDMYYISLYDQIMSLKEDVVDNQTLIRTLDDEELLLDFSKYVDGEVSETIKNAFEQTEGCAANEEVSKAFQDAMKQVALAV